MIASLGFVLCVAIAGENVALRAQATASESQSDLLPEKAIDGDPVSRWSAIPGHNTGVWYELAWDGPVRVAELVIHQHDRYVKEFDVALFEPHTQAWRTMQHIGRADRKLPLVIVVRFAARETTRLRIQNITNGPSFTEVEVHAATSPPLTTLAADLQGHLVGMVCDAFGSAPLPGARVTLTGGTPHGAWSASALSDAQGLFLAPMPLGLNGTLAIATELDGQTTQGASDAAALAYGLTPFMPDQVLADLCGAWRFAPDPPDSLPSDALDDAAWATLLVPSHWAMAGFSGDVGGYRKHFSLGAVAGRIKLLFDGVYSGAECG
ncbi:MAG: hypothetical protein U1E76_14150 [Planctomycetota bacterium]